MSQLLTVKKTSTILQISPSTVYRYCDRGLLPCIKIGSTLRIKQEDLENCLSQRKREFSLSEKILNKALTNPFVINIDNAKGGVKEVARAKTRHNFGYGAIYIRKTKKGRQRFYIDYYSRDRSRKQELVKNATTWEEAAIALKNAVLRELSSECGVKQKKQKITFKEFSDLFLESYSKPNKKSWKCDYYSLEAHLKPYFGRFTLEEITPLLVEKFRSEKLKARLKQSSTNRLLALLKTMFNVAQIWNYTNSNPVQSVKLFSEKDNLKERILSGGEEIKLIEESAGHLKSIIITALNTGMRRNEILTLTWDRVDLDQRLIQVIKTKSGKNRTIPINDTLFEALKELKKRKKGQYVFANPETRKPFKTIRHSFENACRRSNIQDLRFHDLRHTFSCRLIQRGCDIETLRSLLGHHSITVTERYIHTNSGQKRKAVDLLAAKPKNKVKKREDLLHIRYMKKEGHKEKDATPLFSIN